MLSGDRRAAPARRGMTVLGKIPAVPKPINLPSQRLENRGLDRNVEIVPRGTLSWGSTGRSPPTGGSPWGNSAQSSSPPVNSGAWGGAAKPGTGSGSGSGSVSSNNVGGWVGNSSRPSSAGSGTRPSSAGSIGGHNQDQPASASAWGPTTSRPSSASGVLGQAQSQPMVMRPRSAETRPGSSQSSALSRFADSVGEHASGTNQAWVIPGSSGKLSEEPPLPARFTLTPVDFPSLGSEKNPDLRPQQTSSSSGRPVSADGTVFVDKEISSQHSVAPYDDRQPVPLGSYGSQERNFPDMWRRDGTRFSGPPPADVHWHRDPSHTVPYVGVPAPSDSWRREVGHGAPPVASPADETWRRGGPSIGPYGPSGPGRFPHDPLGFTPQRFGTGAVPYGRGSPAPGGFSHHGDMYGNPLPFIRPGGIVSGRPAVPMGPGMFPSPLQYDGYYGPHGAPPYGNIDEREMMMLGMVGGPGMYGSFPRLPHDRVERHGPGAAGTGPHHPAMHLGRTRDRVDATGYEGDGPLEASHNDFGKHKDGWGRKDGGNFRDGIGSNLVGEGDDGGLGIPTSGTDLNVQKQTTRGPSGGHHHGHRDWGTVCSSDEPMDFSKPVFDEVSSASPGSHSLSTSEMLPKERESLKNKPPCCHFSSHESHESREGHDIHNGGKQLEEELNIHSTSSGQPVDLTDSQKVATFDGEDAKSQKQNMTEGEKFLDLSRDATEILISKNESGIKAGNLVENLKGAGQDNFTSEQPVKAQGDTTDRISSRLVEDSNSENKEEFSARVVSMADTSLCKALQQTPGKAVISGDMPSRVSIPSSATCVVVETSVSIAENQSVEVSQGGNLGNSIFEGEGLKNNDKFHILKRTGDACPDSVTNNVHLESSKDTGTVQEPAIKDDHKPKYRFNSHERDKEWRPKVPAVEPRMQPTKSSGNAQAQARNVSATVTAAAAPENNSNSEKGASELENSQSFDSYDYDAQRARMKEIAAQRSRQLQKEEEERTKEQKAKAFAKLEELNKRTSAALSSLEATVSEGTSGEAIKVRPVLEGLSSSVSGSQQEFQALCGTIESSVAAEDAGISVKIEHEKPERDRKRTVSSREEFRPKASSLEQKDLSRGKSNGSQNVSRIEPPLLPSPLPQPANSNALLPSPVAPQGLQQQQLSVLQTAGSTQQHVISRTQQVRQRTKQHAPQTKQQSNIQDEEHFLSVPVHISPLVATREMTGSGDGLICESVDAHPMSSEASGAHVAPASGAHEATTVPRKKKNNRGVKNKHRVEGAAVTVAEQDSVVCELSSADDLSGDMLDGKQITERVRKNLTIEPADGIVFEVKNNPPFELVTTESGKGIVFGSIQDAVDIDVDMPRTNDDAPNKKIQRKSQSVRRFRERGSHDPRAMEKPHANEGMVWAPVRSLSNQVGVGVEASKTVESNVESFQDCRYRSEENTSTSSVRSKRAELERYTPKPIAKQQLQQINDQHLVTIAHHPHAQMDESENSMSGETEVHRQDTGKLQANVSTGVKPISENKASEAIRSGQSHTWRQRNSNDNNFSRVASSNEGRGGGMTKVPLPQVENPSKQQQLDPQQQQSTFNDGTFSEQRGFQRQKSSGLQPALVPMQQPKLHSLLTASETNRQLGHPPQSQGTCLPAQAAQSQDSQKNFPYVQNHPSSYQSARSVRSKSVKHHTRHDGEYFSSTESSTLKGSGPEQPGKQDLTLASSERERKYFQEQGDTYRRPRSAGSHNFRHQGSLDERDHSNSNAGSHFQPKTSYVAQSKAGQVAANYHEKEHPIPQKSQMPNQQFKSQAYRQSYGGKERFTSDHSSKNHESASFTRQQAKIQAFPLDGDTGQVVSEIQQQPGVGPINRRHGFPASEREPSKEVGHVVSHQHRKQGFGHLQWQQTVPPVTEKVETTALPPIQKQQSASSLKSSESSESSFHQNAKLDTKKMHLPISGDSQKNTQYQPVSQPGQPVKHYSQKSAFTTPDTKSDMKHGYPQQNNIHQMGDQGDNFNFKARDHGLPRRGRFGMRTPGGRGADMDSRREQLPKQRLVIDATGNAIPGQVVG